PFFPFRRGHRCRPTNYCPKESWRFGPIRIWRTRGGNSALSIFSSTRQGILRANSKSRWPGSSIHSGGALTSEGATCSLRRPRWKKTQNTLISAVISRYTRTRTRSNSKPWGHFGISSQETRQNIPSIGGSSRTFRLVKPRVGLTPLFVQWSKVRTEIHGRGVVALAQPWFTRRNRSHA